MTPLLILSRWYWPRSSSSFANPCSKRRWEINTIHKLNRMQLCYNDFGKITTQRGETLAGWAGCQHTKDSKTCSKHNDVWMFVEQVVDAELSQRSGSLQRARLPITGCLIINLLIMLHTMLNKWNLNLLMIGKEHFCAYPSTDVDFTGYVMSLTSWLHSELAKVEPTGQSWPVIWFSLAQQIMNHDYYEITILVIFCFIFSWPKKYSLNIKDI